MCERQKRKGCLDTTKTVNATSFTGPSYMHVALGCLRMHVFRLACEGTQAALVLLTVWFCTSQPADPVLNAIIPSMGDLFISWKGLRVAAFKRIFVGQVCS